MIHSGNIESTKKEEHILEMSELEMFCGYYLQNFKDQRRHSSCLATVIFPGTPCIMISDDQGFLYLLNLEIERIIK